MYFSKFTFCLFRQSSTYTSVLKCYENVHFYSTLRNKSVFDFAKDIKYINKRNSRRLFSKYANKVNGKQDKVKRKLPNKDELFRFIRLAKPERLRIAGAIGFLVITSGVTLAVPYCLGKVIDIIYSTPKNEMKEKLQNFCLVLMVVFIVGGLANFGRVYLMETAGQRIIQNIRKGVYSSILKQETAFFDKNKSGELVNRLSSDTTVVGFSVTMNISDGLRSLFGAIAGVSMMFYTSVQLAFVGMGTFPPVALLMVFYGRYMIQIAKNIQNSLAASTQVASEHISNIRTVRAFSQEDKEIKKYNNHINNVLSLIYKECLVKGVFFGLTGMSGNFIILAVLYQGGMMMTEAQLSVGQLTSFLMYAAYVAMSVGGMSSFYSELIKGVGASSRLFELLDRKSLIPIKGGVFPSAHMLGSISFENVAFRYPSRPESIIFENLNLNVQPGSILAVVGGSGSGKSTIGGLLLRFYDPNAGIIKIDGYDVKELDPSWFRQQIGTVSQEPILFSGTIKENILYSMENSESVSEEQLEHVARQANAFDFIQNFPEKFETIVGERGVMLSGGQKQRIAIARAIVSNPRILILDEATSALDAESEHLVQQALERVMKQRTVITIAHRLSTIKNAGYIAVLHEGNVVEYGNYSELMKIPDGMFSKLVHRQTVKS